jgi:hypothetical protein
MARQQMGGGGRESVQGAVGIRVGIAENRHFLPCLYALKWIVTDSLHPYDIKPKGLNPANAGSELSH